MKGGRKRGEKEGREKEMERYRRELHSLIP